MSERRARARRTAAAEAGALGGGGVITLAFPLVGASNAGGFLGRCDPLTQTLFV